MSSWKKVKLSEIIESINTGLDAIRRAPIVDFSTDIRCLRIQDISQNKDFNNWGFTEVRDVDYQKFQLKKDDIIMARTCSTGICFLVKNDLSAVFNNGLARIRVNSLKVDPKYLFYVFKSSNFKGYIDGISGGTSVQLNMKIGDLSKYEFYLPPLDIQKNIATYLSILDDKIELNTQINQTLEQIAQAIFKSWFIDFDPVKAKAEAKAQGSTDEQANIVAMSVISGKSPDQLNAYKQTHPTDYQQLHQLAQAFPSEFEEIDGVEVPKGWGICKLQDLGKIVCGKTPSKSKVEYYGEDIPFIKIPDMHNKTFITKTNDCLSLLGANSQKNKFIPKGSVCVSCIATVGLVSIASTNSQTNQQINSIMPNNMSYSSYLYLYLSQKSMKKKMLDLASGGSATLNMNTTTFSNIEVLNPQNEIILIFDKYTRSLFEKILKNEVENSYLENMRDFLLPKLLSGEVVNV